MVKTFSWIPRSRRPKEKCITSKGEMNAQHLETLRFQFSLYVGCSRCWGAPEADSPRVFTMVLPALRRVYARNRVTDMAAN